MQSRKGYGPRKSRSFSRDCISSTGRGFMGLSDLVSGSYLKREEKASATHPHIFINGCRDTEVNALHSSMVKNRNGFSKGFKIIFRHLTAFLILQH